MLLDFCCTPDLRELFVTLKNFKSVRRNNIPMGHKVRNNVMFNVAQVCSIALKDNSSLNVSGSMV